MTTTDPSSNRMIEAFREDVRRLDKGHYDDRVVLTCYQAKKILAEIDALMPPSETTGSRTSEEAILRGLLAAVYSGSNLYRDDGELQDGADIPVIDYLRDSVLEIERKIRERGRRKLARSPEEPVAKPNDAVRWICPVCTTVNSNNDARCCIGSCAGRRPEKASGCTCGTGNRPGAIHTSECALSRAYR